MPNKKLYRYYEDGFFRWTLRLSDEQAAVFNWLEAQGIPIMIEPIDIENIEEIKTEEWIEGDKNND